ncbi:MAG: integrase arm-type DNA-binding domain-containing protein [Gemmatimonas sp.]
MPKLATRKLTKRVVESAALPTGEDRIVWDGEIRGFGVRVYASGRRLFVFQYREPMSGQSRRLTIGEFPTITVEQARSVAQRAAGQVAAGTDPKAGDDDTLHRRTFGEVFPEYLQERRGKIATRTMQEYERLWSATLAPTFGTKRVSALDEGTVTRWHASRVSTPIVANRAVDLLSSLCAWAERRGYRPRHSNPCVDVERFEEQRRSRSLTREEYARLGAAFVEAERVGVVAAPELRRKSTRTSKAKHRPKSADQPKRANPVALAALRFLVLSGWREQEALSLRWDAINFERGVVVLTDTKSGRSERALGAPALALLSQQRRHEGNPYVFPGEHTSKHLADPKRLWQSLKHSAQLATSQPMRLHDLRHSFTTVARDELGLGDHVIARLVGHKISGMTSRYGEVRDATIRNAANSVTTLIDRYLSGTEASVLTFPAPHVA